MRYIQMIKRCKIPLKMATSDMEAHSEEQAKRCTMSTADLRVPSWEDRLGHLRHSTVARLLVEGKLPVESGTSGPLGDCGAAMDLSKSSVLDKARNFHRDEYRMKSESVDLIDATADRVRHQMGVEMEALKTRSSSSEVRFGGWKCRYCPYSTNTPKKLYSHYQFHQQLLTSQSSKPHMEWLTAYRRAKDFSDGNSPPVTSPLNTSVTSPPGGDPYASCNVSTSGSPAPVFAPGGFPPGLDDPIRLQAMRANGLSLRYLLGGKGHVGNQPMDDQNSASGCLRSIVQAVMKQGARTPQMPMSTTTSVYASLANNNSSSSSSPTSSLSPKITNSHRQSPCVVIGPTPPTMTQLPHHQTVVALADGHMSDVSNNGHAENSGIVRPQPRRAGALDLQLLHRDRSDLSNGHVDSVTEPRPDEQVGYKHTTSLDCPPLEVSSHLRRTVTVECQGPLSLVSVPERPASRESTSSFTSSTSSEINVDDSPIPYNSRRIESLVSERCHGDLGIARVLSRKRLHSVTSEQSCRGILLQQHSTGNDELRDLSCRTEELEMNPAAKLIRLDCASDSRIKVERSFTPEAAKLGNASPIAVISSTGTPPPLSAITGFREEEDEEEREGGGGGLWQPTSVNTQDRAVQCDLLVPPSGEKWPNPLQQQQQQQQQQLGSGLEAFANMPDQSTNEDGGYLQRPVGTPLVIGSVKCPHCGIMFDDSVLHSIHMGCHSHSDPFICNVCGEQCCNKYGFYTHIMRGHHKH